MIEKFESIQKRAVKWILGEQFYSYSKAYYVQKLVDLDILPMAQKFILNDMILFYKIVNELVQISLPSYINSRTNTRSASLESKLAIDKDSVQHPIKNVFGHSFFPRCISTWNRLPCDVRSCENLGLFTSGIKSYLWKIVLGAFDDSDYELEPD